MKVQDMVSSPGYLEVEDMVMSAVRVYSSRSKTSSARVLNGKIRGKVEVEGRRHLARMLRSRVVQNEGGLPTRFLVVEDSSEMTGRWAPLSLTNIGVILGMDHSSVLRLLEKGG